MPAPPLDDERGGISWLGAFATLGVPPLHICVAIANHIQEYIYIYNLDETRPKTQLSTYQFNTKQQLPDLDLKH